MEKPTKEELKALIDSHGFACSASDWAYADNLMTEIETILDALYAEVTTDHATELAECRQVLSYTSNALQRSRSWASPKRDYDKAFSPFTEASVRFSEGVATPEDRAVLGLPKREVPTDAS